MSRTVHTGWKATRLLTSAFAIIILMCALILIRHVSSKELGAHAITEANFQDTASQQTVKEETRSAKPVLNSKHRGGGLPHTQASEVYGKLPLSFELNMGQADGAVKFISRGDGYNLSLAANEAVLTLRKYKMAKKEPESSFDKPSSFKTTSVRWKLIGANASPQIQGREQLPGKVNYFTGRNSQQWRANIPTYARVQYSNVYPGVDLVYYGNNRQLEYDFIISPGADPKKIGLAFDGAQKLRINKQGDLVLSTREGEIRQQRPVIYQEVEGTRREIAGRYVLKGRHQVGFEIAAYDASRPLIIDPVIAFSTFLGGTNEDFGYDIAVDAAGNSYVTGYTVSNDFPTANPFQATRKGAADVFVTKLNPSGTALIYSTYLGGTSSESGTGIEVDAAGNAYITGSTPSLDFPTTPGAYQPAKSSGEVSSQYDAFITKLNPAGNALVFSTYLGGGRFQEDSNDIKIDQSGNVYITGNITMAAYNAQGSEFPVTPGAVQPNYGGNSDAFVAKLDSSGSALLYATFLGGSQHDYANAIAVDFAGHAYVAGETYSNEFPTTPGAYRPTKTDSPSDAFVTKLNETGSALVYSTFIGGPNNSDAANNITVDSAGNAYITGGAAGNYPVSPGGFSAINSNYPNLTYVFVTKFNQAGSALVYSSRFGGSDHSRGNAIAVDSAGNAYVTGYTRAFDFPIVNAFQPQKRNGADVFISELNPAGSRLVFSSFLGGTGSDDTGTGIALDSSANIYVTGFTHSRDFPITDGAFQTLLNRSTFGNAHDAFVTKITPGDTPPPPANSSISGRVMTDGGAPMGGVTLTVYSYQTFTTTTDNNGNYSFTNLQNGADYSVYAEKANYNFYPSGHYLRNVTGHQTADFTGTLKTYMIMGTITDDLSRPLSDVTVTLSGSLSDTTTTDSNGNYYFYATAEGSYTVTPSKLGYRFNPQSLQYNNLSTDQWSANFKATLIPEGLPRIK